LFFVLANVAAGVILLRIDAVHESERAAVIAKFWSEIEQAAPGHFVVVTSTTVPRTPIPHDAPNSRTFPAE
jgi:hypothetical protein